MTSIQNFSGQVSLPVQAQKQQLATGVNFRAGEVDSFIRQSSPSSQDVEMMRSGEFITKIDKYTTIKTEEMFNILNKLK